MDNIGAPDFFAGKRGGYVMKREIKICYIGGGSKLWARVFMSDLAVAEGLSGEIALYDIDKEAAERNAKIGGHINRNRNTVVSFRIYQG